MIESIIQQIRDQQKGREVPLQMLEAGTPGQAQTIDWSQTIPSHRSEGFTGLPTEIDFAIAVDEYQDNARGYVIRIRQEVEGDVIEMTDQDGPLVWTQKSWRLEIRPKFFDGTFSGWGWRAEMVGNDETISPAARSIALYSDAAHTQFLYTPGAFVRGPSEFYPGDAWAMESPAGQLTQTRQDIHFATLWGSVQEAKGTLASDAEAAFARYWIGIEGEQPGTGEPVDPPSGWTDSGATTNGPSGANTMGVSDDSPFSAGQTIRVAQDDNLTTTVTGIHSNNLLLISPHITVGSGQMIEIQS